jgi:hypothetical protein
VHATGETSGDFQQAVTRGGQLLAGALGAVPVVGPLLAVAGGAALEEWGDDIGDAINDLLGTEDDHIGTLPLDITAKQMVTLPLTPLSAVGGIKFNLKTPRISDGDSQYTVFFEVIFE